MQLVETGTCLMGLGCFLSPLGHGLWSYLRAAALGGSRSDC